MKFLLLVHIRQHLAVALLAVALVGQVQTGIQNTVFNPELEQSLNDWLKWIKIHYPERYATMYDHKLDMPCDTFFPFTTFNSKVQCKS